MVYLGGDITYCFTYKGGFIFYMVSSLLCFGWHMFQNSCSWGTSDMRGQSRWFMPFPFLQKHITSAVFDAHGHKLPCRKCCWLIVSKVWSLGNCWRTGLWLCLGHTRTVQYQGRKCLMPYKCYRMDPLQNQIKPLGEKHANKLLSSTWNCKRLAENLTGGRRHVNSALNPVL